MENLNALVQDLANKGIITHTYVDLNKLKTLEDFVNFGVITKSCDIEYVKEQWNKLQDKKTKPNDIKPEVKIPEPEVKK